MSKLLCYWLEVSELLFLRLSAISVFLLAGSVRAAIPEMMSSVGISLLAGSI